MPVSRNFQVYVASNEAFHDAAEKLIGIAFDLQNQRGRYLKEWNYQLAMQGRIEAAGLGDAIREGEIVLSFQTFQKSLFTDLLFDSMLLLEIKATQDLCPADEAQLLQYLALLGLRDGLLLNFGSPQVQKRFVSTLIPSDARHQISVDSSRWSPDSEDAKELATMFQLLIKDWGSGLKRSLYLEAVVHCMGGSEAVVQEVAVNDAKIQIGYMPLNMVGGTSAFTFMTKRPDSPGFEKSLQKLVDSTSLKNLHWINLYHQELKLITLANRRWKR
ncbi:hypothetical protein LF1_02200 [Rubripirellula obstinata]|uniref:GxxExxY protein n=1 Tax=Rubripirellula obstinata TaxID=406547 RepID=A0A5B1CBW5_9BACT|nr:GxxExxY protein [Rubripirellula obstinata]KAA1257731.1 hypothetical protein LF1_02200 [Rubripirellula obstinata]